MKKIVPMISLFLGAALFYSCDFGSGSWDPNQYKVLQLNGNKPFYDFRTGLTYSQIASDKTLKAIISLKCVK